MLLAIDIGNSNIVSGLYTGNQWQYIWRHRTIERNQLLSFELFLSNLFLENTLHPTAVKAVVLSSVVPELTSEMMRFLSEFTEAQVLNIDPPLVARLPLSINKPAIIGSDLVANAYAAREKYGSTLVVDFGTALTFLPVDRDRGLLGVTIAPGIRTMMTSLSGKTARLPEVELRLPQSSIGRDTIHAMQAGILFGAQGMIRELTERISAEAEIALTKVATGGLSGVLGDFMEQYFDLIDPSLTLDGMRLIFEHFGKNR